MNLPWTVALAVDGSEGSTSESGVGIAEARGIGKVKELAAQLESHILLELEAFEDGEVQVMNTVSAYNPGIAWGSAVMLGQWFGEGSRIETNPIPVKAAMAHLKLCLEEMRLPLVPMGADARKKLFKALGVCPLLKKTRG